jgi:hypothetical protein
MKKKLLLMPLAIIAFATLAQAQIKAQQECVFDAQFSSSNISMPATLYPDQKGQVTITVENIGTCIWKGNEVELKVSIYKGPSGAKVQRDELVPSAELYAQTTGYREHYKFIYEMEGPYYLGEYTLEFVMIYKGQKFGDVVKKTIKIVPKN